MFKILHISAHYGGGVGTVINAWRSHDTLNHHTLSCLNESGNLFGFKNINDADPLDSSLVSAADVVVCHVWNHPSTFDFLINSLHHLPPCRFIIWDHVSGLYAPYVHSNSLLEVADKFVLTSPVSYECKELNEFTDQNKISVIWSTYGIGGFKSVERKHHSGFNIGITGTMDYGKLHPEFINLCSMVNIMDAKFIVCSNDSQEHLKFKAQEIGLQNIKFMGKVPNVKEHLETFDVFGYPLQPKHFGSCEQSLGEAMLCGAVPVVLDNPAERYIVQNNRTGIIASSLDDYVAAIKYLYTHDVERNAMSIRAMIAAKKLYDIDNSINKWNSLFDNIMKGPKTLHYWSDKYSTTCPAHLVYIASMGQYGKAFSDYVFCDLIGDSVNKKVHAEKIHELYQTNPMFQSDSKGSIKQYQKFFPYNNFLKEWGYLL